MINITILGATGPTGQQIVQQALARGWGVCAVVRSAVRLGPLAARVEVIEGDVFAESTLAQAILGRDAVLSAIGAPAGFLWRGATTVYSRSASALIAAMHTAAVSRLVFCTSAGVEPRDPSEVWLYRRIAKPLFLQRAYNDMQAAEQAIAASTLDWTLVRPGRLIDGPPTGRFRVSPRFRPEGGINITRADLAAFMLDQVKGHQWVHKTPTLTE